MTRVSGRYPFLGPAVLVEGGFEGALAHVRELWPTASAEGSTGPERTFFVKTEEGSGLVGHYWPGAAGSRGHVRRLAADQAPFVD